MLKIKFVVLVLILLKVCKSLQCSNQEGQKMKCGSFGSDSSEEICLQNSFCCYNETSKPPCYVNMDLDVAIAKNKAMSKLNDFKTNSSKIIKKMTGNQITDFNSKLYRCLINVPFCYR